MSAIYPKFREFLMDRLINDLPTPATQIRVAGVSSAYVFSGSHVDSSDVPDPSILAPDIEVSDFTYLDGILDCDDLSWTGLTDGGVIAGVIFFAVWDGGDRLIAYVNETTNAQLPYEIVAGTMNVRINENGICRV